MVALSLRIDLAGLAAFFSFLARDVALLQPLPPPIVDLHEHGPVLDSL